MANELLDRLNRGTRILFSRGPRAAFQTAIYGFYSRRHEALKQRVFPHDETEKHLIILAKRKFELHSSMKGLSEELYLFGSHEPVASEIYARLLKPGDHVIDIGSNIGYFLLLAANSITKSGRILSFEPVAQNFEILQRNIAEIDGPWIKTLPWAISAVNGLTTFYESEIPNWGSLIQDRNLRQKRAISVTSSTLDDCLCEYPEFHPAAIRMDVDGGELMILEGANRILGRYKPLLFVEFHTFALSWEGIRDCLLHLQGIGYAQAYLIDRTWDQPWIAPWARNMRCWRGTLDDLINRIHTPAETLSIFTLVIERPA